MKTRRWLIPMLNMILVMNVFSQQTGRDSSQVLEDVIVEESYEAEFQEDKLPAPINVDFGKIVQVPKLIHWAGIDDQDLIPRDPAENFPGLEISSPALANIRPAPIKVFHTQFKNLAYWQLEVHKSDGSLFKSFSGEKSPPEFIPWDGQGDASGHLIPGRNYSYDFTAINKAGNKRVFPGKTFSVPAFYLRDENGITVAIAMSELVSEDGLKLESSADEYALEIAGLFRYFSNNEYISIRASHPTSDEFVGLVANHIRVDKSKINRISQGEESQDHMLIRLE